MADIDNVPPNIRQVADFLDARLGVNDAVPLVWRKPPGSQNDTRTIHRIGLALDEKHNFNAQSDLDAVFLHRPFMLPPGDLANAVIFAVHKGFDDHLSIGYNRALAQALGLEDIYPLFRNQAIIGMLGKIAVTSWEGILARLLAEFGGAEQISTNEVSETVEHIAFVGAMTPELIEQAAKLGATVYVTGQFRRGVQSNAEARNMAIVAVGHWRAEMWGLQQLARELSEAFPALEEVRVSTEPGR